MNFNVKLERDILIYLEDYNNTTFRDYSPAEVGKALQVLLREKLIKESPFNMETANRSPQELQILKYMLTINGHELVEQLRGTL